jgi:hypothetical protein
MDEKKIEIVLSEGRPMEEIIKAFFDAAEKMSWMTPNPKNQSNLVSEPRSAVYRLTNYSVRDEYFGREYADWDRMMANCICFAYKSVDWVAVKIAFAYQPFGDFHSTVSEFSFMVRFGSVFDIFDSPHEKMLLENLINQTKDRVREEISAFMYQFLILIEPEASEHAVSELEKTS